MNNTETLTDLINLKLSEEKIASEREIKQLKQIIWNYKHLYQAAQVINSTIKLDEALQVIINILAKVLNAKTISIMLLDPLTDELVVQAAKHERDIIGQRKKLGEGVSGKVAITGLPTLVPDLKKVNLKSFLADKEALANSYMCIPLRSEDTIIGVINVTEKIDGGFFTERDKKIVLGMAKQIFLAIVNANLYSSVEILALQDGLTKLHNRYSFQKNLYEEIKKAKIKSYHLSLIMLDIDFFKSINDTYGHPVGDEVLKKVASILKNTLRKTDIAARYGGEEMIGILMSANCQEAFLVAEKVRNHIQDINLYCLQLEEASEEAKNIIFEYSIDKGIEILLYPFSQGEGPFPAQEFCLNQIRASFNAASESFKVDDFTANKINVAVSMGVSSFPEDFSLSSMGQQMLENTNEQDLLIYMADKALYKAKKNGRNRTLTYQSVQLHSGFKKETELEMMTTILAKLKEKDNLTYTHALRVGKISEIIAKHLQLRKEEQILAKYGGALHDIGKIFIDDYLIYKPDKLTDNEYQIIRTHTNKGAEIIEAYPTLHKYINGIRLHHERWNGTGYPERLSGSRIPIEALIIGVADSYDALTSDRYYRDKSSPIDRQKALNEIVRNADILYDKAVVDAFVANIAQIDALENWPPVLD